MKKIEAIIKPQVLGAILNALREVDLGEATVFEVQGRGRHRGGSEVYRGAVYPIDTFMKLRVELLVSDERVDEVVSLFCRVARTRGPGNGKILVAAVAAEPGPP